MLQYMMGEKEQCFWLKLDLKSGEVLELRVPHQDVQTEDVGQWVRWKPVPILAQEGPPLAPLTEVPMEIEESGAAPAQEDGAAVDDDAMAEYAT